MMHLALERCFGIQEVQGVLIDPLVTNTGAQLFYQSMGFRALGVQGSWRETFAWS
jgi:aminoglycoside 6'-N-acetyltransferase